MKNVLTWATIGLVVFVVLSGVYGADRLGPEKISYTQFVKAAEDGQLSRVYISEHDVQGQYRSGQSFLTQIPVVDGQLLNRLLSHQVDVVARPAEPQNIWVQIFINWFPSLAFVVLWFWMIRQMQGGMGGRSGMPFGRSKPRMLGPTDAETRFSGVAGMDEAKREVSELVEFLKNPKKFQRLGGRVPCGVLLVGPPGTGKTLLARAVAGEAGVPFFSISASSFVQMFVGVGASRVRDLFEEAKKQAPCIIFIDEIDAVARARGSGWSGGHDEREQTLVELLVQMDGFERKDSVIVIAATNRSDVLDQALLRPGRFDRQVYVSLPDIRGREAILNIYLKRIVVDSKIDVRAIAQGTTGLSGADLENLVNEAALLAAGKNKECVSTEDLEQAKDKILLGVQRENLMTPEEKRLTAYHESGHAIVSWLLLTQNRVYKVTIMPRGRALGLTFLLQDREIYSMSLAELKGKLASLLGGRVAEELIAGPDHVTTGASNDIERVTEIARSIVKRWGLDASLGPIYYGDKEEGGLVSTREFSEKTAEQIDQAVSALVREAYAKARAVLEENMDILHAMSKALMEYETIDEAQVALLMQRKSLEAPEVVDDLA